MNPKEFPWEADQQITVKNTTDDDFRFQVNSKWYAVRAGQRAKMAGYIAWVFTYKLANKIALDTGEFEHWNEEGFRQKYYNQIVIAIDDTVQEIIAEEPDADEFEDAEDLTTPDKGDPKIEEADSTDSAEGRVKPMKAKRKVAKKA